MRLALIVVHFNVFLACVNQMFHFLDKSSGLIEWDLVPVDSVDINLRSLLFMLTTCCRFLGTFPMSKS